MKELLDGDDLVLTGESREEVVRMLLKWKLSMENNGFKLNMEKTEMKASGSKEVEPVRSVRYLCAACLFGVEVNSVLCTQCGKGVTKDSLR